MARCMCEINHTAISPVIIHMLDSVKCKKIQFFIFPAIQLIKLEVFVCVFALMVSLGFIVDLFANVNNVAVDKF